MGKLLTLYDLKKDEGELVPWYFKEAYFDGYSQHRGYKFKWPSEDYPFPVAIHSDEIGDNKPVIRRFIESNIDCTVIYGTEDKTYRVWYSDDPKKREWDHTSQISNIWHLFYFEDEENALVFSLRFGDIVKPMTEDHPTKHYGERYKR